MSAPPELLPSALKMFSALVMIIGGLLLAVHVSKRFLKTRAGKSNDRLIRVLASSYVGVKKNIALVEVPGEILVVGITADNINLLSKINDPKTIERLKGSEPKPRAATFVEQLQSFSSKLRRANDGS